MATTNVRYLKDNNLYEAHEHFMRLSEGYIPRLMPEEELEEDDQDPNADQMGGGAPQDPMGGGQDMNGGMPPMDGGQVGDPNAMGQDMNGGMPPMDGGQGDIGEAPQGGDPNGGMPPMDEPIDDEPPMDEEPSDDGDTIDIGGLTKAQAKLNVKQNHIGRDLSKVDASITSLIDTIKTLQSALDSNNAEIEALKAEFEKRNPTQTEKLNLRSLDSYPFNVKPTDYWEKKAADGGYEAYSDNGEPTTKEYEITNDDVDNPSNDIADTFFKIDDDDIQTMDKLFRI